MNINTKNETFIVIWINSKALWIPNIKSNDFESKFFSLNMLRNKQTVLIYIALLQCTCQIYTNTAVFKIYKMIIIRYPRGTLFTSDISIILGVTNG